jgi:hypothetical protein
MEWRRPTVKSIFGAATFGGQLIFTGVEGVVLRNQLVPRLTPANFLGYDQSLVTETNGVTSYELFLFGGEPDQFFAFQSSTNLATGSWSNNASLELFDASGTMYLLRSRDQTNTPPHELYRTMQVP